MSTIIMSGDENDDADDLSSLLASLESVQQQRATLRLTERNTVELVQKLFERQLFIRAGERERERGSERERDVAVDIDGEKSEIDSGLQRRSDATDTEAVVELLHTLDGKEYMTFDRLVMEVLATLKRRAGRVAISDLPEMLTVDVAHCERAARQLVDKNHIKDAGYKQRGQKMDHNYDIIVLQDELIMSTYFDELAREVAETLSGTGVVSIAELAQRFSLSADVIRSQLGSRTETLGDAKLEGGILSSPAHTARLRYAFARATLYIYDSSALCRT